jgi:hypothetical protein
MTRPPSSGTPGDALGLEPTPEEVAEYAGQAVEYVRRAVAVALEYDSDTLPLLDHYLRAVPRDNAAAAHLVAAAAGAYFGEVVRRTLGGTWELPSGDPGEWRMVLPSGLWFSPAAMALGAINSAGAEDDLDAVDEGTNPDVGAPGPASEWDASLHAPPDLREVVAQVLERMAEVSPEEYYSLCCRFDTLEHVQAVLTGVASENGRE